MFGLSDKNIINIKKTFAKIPKIEKVVLYGSRAKGNYHNGSDIDITIFGEDLSLENSIYPLIDLLDELYLPYMFDISIFDRIDNENLKDHIKRVGKIFYIKEKELPKNWEVRKLGEVCDFQNGFAFKSKTYKETGLPILRITNIQDNNLGTKKLVYFNESDYKENLERFQVLKEDLVIAMSGATTGKLGVNNTDKIFYLNQRVGKFIPKKGLSKSFLHYFLSTKIEESLKISAGAAQPNLSTEQIKGFKIPTPPLEEQKQIVAILDKAFEKIDEGIKIAKQNLKNTKELFESYLQEIFENKGNNWEEKTLNEIYDVRDGTHDSPKYQESGYPLITSKNLKKDLLNYDRIKYISKEDYININKRSKVNKGDILFAMIGTIGNPVVIENEPDFAIKNVALFKVPQNQNAYFLKYYLDSRAVIDKMKNEAKGTTQQFVGLGYLRSFKIQITPLKTQTQIVNKLNQLQEKTKALESIYQQKLANLEELKKSILQKVFNGELVISTTNQANE